MSNDHDHAHCLGTLALAGLSPESALQACLQLQLPRRLESGDDCDSSEQDGFADFGSSEAWIDLGVALFCILGAAMAAGLTLGIVSLEALDLRVKLRSGTEEERHLASRLLPIVEHRPHHQLLVTLLLCNSIFNETLPLFLDELVPSWAAIIISVTAVLFVGEIIPSAIFSGPQRLALASGMSGLVWLVMTVLAPIAYPIAIVLDKCIPEEAEVISRGEIRAMVEIHREIARKEGTAEPFNEDEEHMIKGALSLSGMKVSDEHVIQPMGKIFSLPLDGIMDYDTMTRIIQSGFSRIPIHAPGDETLLLGYIITKDHIMLHPSDMKSISELQLYKPAVASPSMTLAALLNEFQTGSSHLAFVSRNPPLLREAMAEVVTPSGQVVVPRHSRSKISSAAVVGIVTLEDVIETLLSEQVYDELDRKLATDKLVEWMREVAVPTLRRRAHAHAHPPLSNQPVPSSTTTSTPPASTLAPSRKLRKQLQRHLSQSEGMAVDGADPETSEKRIRVKHKFSERRQRSRSGLLDGQQAEEEPRSEQTTSSAPAMPAIRRDDSQAPLIDKKEKAFGLYS